MKASIDAIQIWFVVVPMVIYLGQEDWVGDIATLKNKVVAKKLQILHFFLSKKMHDRWDNIGINWYNGEGTGFAVSIIRYYIHFCYKVKIYWYASCMYKLPIIIVLHFKISYQGAITNKEDI